MITLIQWTQNDEGTSVRYRPEGVLWDRTVVFPRKLDTPQEALDAVEEYERRPGK